MPQIEGELVQILRTAWRSRLALVAALLFVLQAVFGMAGTATAAPSLDIFGNPLCITDPSGAPVDHGHSTDCCILACGMAFSAAAPSEDASLPQPRRAHLCVVAFSPKPALIIAAPDHDPGNPRAPPLTA